MRRIWFPLAAVVLMAAGPLSAQTNAPNAVPRMEPVILGEVSHSTSHTFTVLTGEGPPVEFEFDSGSMMPARLEPGVRVRVEFRLMDSGLHLARRVTPIESGTSDWATLDERLAAARAAEAARQQASMNETQTTTSGEPATSNTSEPAEASTMEASTQGTTEELPATASALPLLLGMGVVLLVLAAALWMVRRRIA